MRNDASQHRKRAEQQGRDDHDRQHRDQAAGEPEPEDERRHDDRPERVARVAADVEERHARRPLPAAGERGELRSLGVVSRDPEPGEKDESEDEDVGRCDGREPGRDPCQRDPGGQQPGCAAPIRPEPEERLHERRGREHGEHEHRRGGVAEVELEDEERKQGRDGAGGEVDREVTAGERRHRPAIELLVHTGEATARSAWRVALR